MSDEAETHPYDYECDEEETMEAMSEGSALTFGTVPHVMVPASAASAGLIVDVQQSYSTSAALSTPVTDEPLDFDLVSVPTDGTIIPDDSTEQSQYHVSLIEPTILVMASDEQSLVPADEMTVYETDQSVPSVQSGVAPSYAIVPLDDGTTQGVLTMGTMGSVRTFGASYQVNPNIDLSQHSTTISLAPSTLPGDQQILSQALVERESEAMEDTEFSDHASTMMQSIPSITDEMKNLISTEKPSLKDDTGISSQGHYIPQVNHQEMYLDDVSIRTRDVFEKNEPMYEKSEPLYEKNEPKLEKIEIKKATYDDQTIATNFTAVPKFKPSTIYEEEDDDEESREVASVYSKGTTTKGLIQRQGGRKTLSREVELSMDGFLHQVKPKVATVEEVDFRSGFYLVDGPDDRPPKVNKQIQTLTIIAILGLVATCSFFAAHIGPFVLQPEAAATTAAKGNTASSDPGNPQSLLGNASLIDSAFERSFINGTIPYKGPNLELPMIWTYPLSGGDILGESFGRCLGKVLAGNGAEYDVNGVSDAWNADSLRVISLSGHLYLNVNLYTTEGIDRAAQLGIASSHVADIVYTPLLYDITKIFEPQEGVTGQQVLGRLLVVFRSPIERALNRFEQARLTTGNNKLTLHEYANNPIYAENNPLTRGLLGLRPEDPLENLDVKIAQLVIRDKILIGLYDQFDVTLERFERYFSWYTGKIAPDIETCHREVWDSFSVGYRVSESYNVVDPIGFNLILAQHKMDVSLYKYAQSQFGLQSAVFPASMA